MKYTLENIIKVDTYIEEYNKISEKLNNEYLINELAVDRLKEIFNIENNDFDIYHSYVIDEKKAKVINNYLTNKIDFDFNKYEYILQRYADYN